MGSVRARTPCVRRGSGNAKPGNRLVRRTSGIGGDRALRAFGQRGGGGRDGRSVMCQYAVSPVAHQEPWELFVRQVLQRSQVRQCEVGVGMEAAQGVQRHVYSKGCAHVAARAAVTPMPVGDHQRRHAFLLPPVNCVLTGLAALYVAHPSHALPHGAPLNR